MYAYITGKAHPVVKRQNRPTVFKQSYYLRYLTFHRQKLWHDWFGSKFGSAESDA